MYLPTPEPRLSKNNVNRAKVEMTEAKAIIVLLQNNLLATEICIAGLKMGVCDNSLIIPAIEHHIKEIEKFLDGEKSEWDD